MIIKTQYLIKLDLFHRAKPHLVSVSIDRGERSLRAVWAPEMAQDIAAYHSMDVEAELTRILNEEVIRQMGVNLMRAYAPLEDIDVNFTITNDGWRVDD